MTDKTATKFRLYLHGILRCKVTLYFGTKFEHFYLAFNSDCYQENKKNKWYPSRRTEQNLTKNLLDTDRLKKYQFISCFRIKNTYLTI